MDHESEINIYTINVTTPALCMQDAGYTCTSQRSHEPQKDKTR